MTKTITQTIFFKGATAKQLYNLYMNAKKHSEVTGEPAQITKKVGEKWSAYGNRIRGENLLVKANKMVVQSWRGKDWERGEPSSIVTLYFTDAEEGAYVHLVQALVPEDSVAKIRKGWREHYWNKWKAHLKDSAK